MTQDRPTDRARACRRRRPHTRATMFTVSAPTHASLRAFKPNTVRANEFVDRARAMARRRATTRRRDDASRCVIGARRAEGFGKNSNATGRAKTRRGRRARARGRALKIYARGAAVDGVERRARAGGGRAGRFEGLGV